LVLNKGLKFRLDEAKNLFFARAVSTQIFSQNDATLLLCA